jgi:hypothetical protein
MSLQDRFGELRSIAHGAPSAEAWAALSALCDLIPAWQADEREAWEEQGIPYMRDALRRWPRDLCVAPWWDTQALLRGNPTSQLFPLARALPRPQHPVTAQELAQLAADPRLSHIESLALNTVDMTPTGFISLVGSPHLHSLTALNVANNPIGQDGALALAASPLAPRLTSLNLLCNALGKRGGSKLLGGPALRNITETLHLSGCQLAPSTLLALANNPDAPQPRSLDLSSNAPHSIMRLIDQFAASYSMRRPQVVDSLAELRGEQWLSICHALIRGRVMERAEVLRLGGFIFDADHAALLMARDVPLRELHLSWVDPETLAALVTHPNAVHLERLSFKLHADQAGALLAALTIGDRLEHLRLLSLYHSEAFTDAHIAKLARWPRLAQLTDIDLPLKRRLAASQA